jgi:hypothetical protein
VEDILLTSNSSLAAARDNDFTTKKIFTMSCDDETGNTHEEVRHKHQEWTAICSVSPDQFKNQTVTNMRQFKFECQVCLENKKEPKSQVRRIDEEPVCRTCTLEEIVPLFEKALRNELEFPPRWGPMELKIRDFQDLMPAAFLRAWDDRMDEYDTPKPSRVYCEHMAFAPAALGEREQLEVCGQFLGSNEESDQFRCPKCKSWSKDHHLHCYCDGVGKQYSNAKGPVLSESIRGLEWQRCPDERCGVIVTLGDGCNHMECAFCNAHFCYVCGYFAAPRSGHWRDGGPCPVYSQQNDPRNNGGVYDADGFDENGFDENGYDQDGYNQDGYQDNDYEGHNDHNGYSDDDCQEDGDHENGFPEHDDSVEPSHQVDVQHQDWANNFFGEPIIVPSPDASTEDQLQYDGMITCLFHLDFGRELGLTYGRLDRASRSLMQFHHLLQHLVRHIEFVKKDLIEDEPTTALDKVERAVDFSNFQIRHGQLRQGFWEAYNLSATLVGPVSVLLGDQSAVLFKRAFDRYMALYAPRHISNVWSDERWKDQQHEGFLFGSERDARRAAAIAIALEEARDELLQHNRHDYEEDSVFS